MIPVEAVEAAALSIHRAHPFQSLSICRAVARAALEAAAPHILAAKVAVVRANHDYIIDGGDGYSAGFHYALHCTEDDLEATVPHMLAEAWEAGRISLRDDLAGTPRYGTPGYKETPNPYGSQA